MEMADISVEKEHGMELEAAKAKVHEVVSGLQKEMDYVDTVDWNSDQSSAKVKGTGFSGRFSVDDKKVSVDIDLKFFAKPLKGKIADKIERHLDRHFG
jgi:putative polyhydroxyalkanoate system protein